MAPGSNRRFDGAHRRPRRRRGGDDGGRVEDAGTEERTEFVPRRRLAGDRRGLGAAASRIENSATLKAIQKICDHIRRVGRAPAAQHDTRATGPSKGNGKE
eukprot:6604775-Pyramimonas_sp.AAC.1